MRSKYYGKLEGENMSTIQELKNSLERIETRNKDISRRIELLSLDASISSKNRIKEILSEKIKSEVIEIYGGRGNRKLHTTDTPGLFSTSIDNEVSQNSTESEDDLSSAIYIHYSFIDRIKQNTILYIMKYVDNDYLYDKLWSILLK